MKDKLTDLWHQISDGFQHNYWLVFGILIAMVPLSSIACEPTATYNGRKMTEREIQSEVFKEKIETQTQFEAAKVAYEQKIKELQAKTEISVAEAEGAIAEIQSKKAVMQEVIDSATVLVASAGGPSTAGAIGLAGTLIALFTGLNSRRKDQVIEAKKEENKEIKRELIQVKTGETPKAEIVS